MNEYGIHLDVVGRGTLTSLVPFGASGLATQPSDGGIRPEPVLLSSSVRGLASLPPLLLFSRNYGWTSAFDPGGRTSGTSTACSRARAGPRRA